MVLRTILHHSGATNNTTPFWCYERYYTILVLRTILHHSGATNDTTPFWCYERYYTILVLRTILHHSGATNDTTPFWCYERYYTILVLRTILHHSGATNDTTPGKFGSKPERKKPSLNLLVEVYLYADLCPQTDKCIKDKLQNRMSKINDIKRELNRKEKHL